MDDNFFRIVLGVYLALFMPVGMYFRLRAHTGEKLDRWQEGAFLLFGLRLVGLAGAISGIAWLIEPRWFLWSKLPLPTAARWCGVALAAAGGLFIAWTFRHLGKNLTDTVVTRAEHALVTSGPYRVVRHPFYVGGFLVGLGCALITSNLWFFALVAAGFALLAARTPIEERKLMERFGVEYQQYRQRVGAFVPRLLDKGLAQHFDER